RVRLVVRDADRPRVDAAGARLARGGRARRLRGVARGRRAGRGLRLRDVERARDPLNGTDRRNVQVNELVSLCKRRGFIFQSSEIYGGINGFWDYGPLGVELKRAIKEHWWNVMVRQRDDI